MKMKIILFWKTKIKINFNIWSYYAIKIWEGNIFHFLITLYYYILPRLRQLFTGLSTRGDCFNPRLLHVGFVVEKLTLGDIFLRIFRFYLFSIVTPFLHIYFIHLSPTLHDPTHSRLCKISHLFTVVRKLVRHSSYDTYSAFIVINSVFGPHIFSCLLWSSLTALTNSSLRSRCRIFSTR